ncbi:DNA topoisomerase IV [Echinicola marina]|uniref:DNA topoisomerase IV n=1 Tax=Echinicola marina TaxID=2859768 RepID=UPI001CF6A349|nr:DNA topoisomerase IV [Echinicola marina]UCS92675.1 DNA topoisomerase IV [Echinicola marina]
MKYRFAKAFHLLSVFLFIVIFLYIYSALPQQVNYEVGESGQTLKIIDKDTFFYAGIGLFIFLNLVFITPAKMIENKSTLNIKKLFRNGDPFKDNMLTWSYSFAAVMNIGIVIIAFYVHGINGMTEAIGNSSGYGLYLIPVFFVIWIIWLFVIVSKKMSSLKSEA